MLGHTITLKRDQNMSIINCSIMMSTVTEDEGQETIMGDIIPHKRCVKPFFRSTGRFTGIPLEIYHCLDPYADFDWIISNNLTILIPQTKSWIYFLTRW